MSKLNTMTAVSCIAVHILWRTNSPADMVSFDADTPFASVWENQGQSGLAGTYVGTSTLNGDGDSNSDGDIDTPSGNAWGLYAAHGHERGTPYFFSASHALSVGLQPGDTLSLSMDTGYVATSSFWAKVGFNIGEFGLWANAGESSNYMFGSSGNVLYQEDSGIPLTDEGIRATFQALAGDSYNLTVELIQSGQTYTFTSRYLGLGTGASLTGVGIYNSASGDSPANDVFFNNLEIVPEPNTAAMLVAGLAALAVQLRRKLRTRPLEVPETNKPHLTYIVADA